MCSHIDALRQHTDPADGGSVAEGDERLSRQSRKRSPHPEGPAEVVQRSPDEGGAIERPTVRVVVIPFASTVQRAAVLATHVRDHQPARLDRSDQPFGERGRSGQDPALVQPDRIGVRLVDRHVCTLCPGLRSQHIRVEPGPGSSALLSRPARLLLPRSEPRRAAPGKVSVRLIPVIHAAVVFAQDTAVAAEQFLC